VLISALTAVTKVKRKPPPNQHQSKGFAFVAYATRAEGEAAKAAIHGFELPNARMALRISFLGEKAIEPPQNVSRGAPEEPTRNKRSISEISTPDANSTATDGGATTAAGYGATVAGAPSDEISQVLPNNGGEWLPGVVGQ